MSKTRVPAIEGWLTMDESNPQLLGYLDESSGTYFFPKDVAISHAPGHADADFKEVALSNTGKLWSYTTNHYKPPEPYLAPTPSSPTPSRLLSSTMRKWSSLASSQTVLIRRTSKSAWT